MPRYRATVDFDADGLKDATELLADGLDNPDILDLDEIPEEEPEDENEEEASA